MFGLEFKVNHTALVLFGAMQSAMTSAEAVIALRGPSLAQDARFEFVPRGEIVRPDSPSAPSGENMGTVLTGVGLGLCAGC